MSIDALFASKAYAEALSQGSSASKGVAAPDAEKAGESFRDLLDNLVQDVVETGKRSEAMTLSSLAGKTEMVDVVTAIADAEMALETVIAVRDKVIDAYQSIMRMPI